MVVRRIWCVVTLFTSILEIGTTNLYSVGGMAELVTSETQRKHTLWQAFQTTTETRWMHTYAGHGNKWRYRSSELCIKKMYTLFLQVNYPEHCMHVQSGLYPTEVNGVTIFRICYHYITLEQCLIVALACRHFFDFICCGCLLFNAENNVEKHSYFKFWSSMRRWQKM